MASSLRLQQMQTVSGTNVVSFDSSGNAIFQRPIRLGIFNNSNRPVGQLGMLIYNSQSNRIEIFGESGWSQF